MGLVGGDGDGKNDVVKGKRGFHGDLAAESGGSMSDGEEAAEGDGGVSVLEGGEWGEMGNEDGFPEMVRGHRNWPWIGYAGGYG